MLTKNELKYYSSLLQKKIRKSEQKFLVEGIKIIQEALDFGFEFEIVCSTNLFYNNNPQIFKLISRKKIRTEILSVTDIGKLCDTKTPQEIVAVIKMKKISAGSVVSARLIVAMENISDPGNMGTILRNCDWFGVKNVLLNSDCAEIFNPKVIRASAGSVFHLNISEEENFYDVLNERKKSGYKILCADLNGENLYDFSHGGNMILVLANEANGPTNELLNLCDTKITIPRIGSAESLNVASASAIILSELTK